MVNQFYRRRERLAPAIAGDKEILAGGGMLEPAALTVMQFTADDIGGEPIRAQQAAAPEFSVVPEGYIRSRARVRAMVSSSKPA